METGDLPPPDLDNAGGWFRYVWRRLRGLLPSKAAGTTKDVDARRTTTSGGIDSKDANPRQNVYNFSGTFYGPITIYEEGDNEPTVELSPKDAKATEEDSDE